MKRLMIIVPITIGLIYLLLFSSFNSLKQAGLIILNVPFAMIGGILGLAISRQYLSVPASVGFIALFGVAVLNGVVLVSYINSLRQEGMELDRGRLPRHGAPTSARADDRHGCHSWIAAAVVLDGRRIRGAAPARRSRRRRTDHLDAADAPAAPDGVRMVRRRRRRRCAQRTAVPSLEITHD